MSDIKKPGIREKIKGLVKEHKMANDICLLSSMNTSFALISIYPLVHLNCIGILNITLNFPL
ncbi:hypothetical protein D3C87_96830 [compost metagenome]